MSLVSDSLLCFSGVDGCIVHCCMIKSLRSPFVKLLLRFVLTGPAGPGQQSNLITSQLVIQKNLLSLVDDLFALVLFYLFFSKYLLCTVKVSQAPMEEQDEKWIRIKALNH